MYVLHADTIMWFLQRSGYTNVYISVTNRERFGVMLDDILITILERRYYQK